MLFYVFPPICGICEKKTNGYICKQCKDKLENSNLFLNKIEDYSNDNTKMFNKHAYLFEYNGEIRSEIIKYKFRNNPYLGKTFAELFLKNKKMCDFLKKYDIIVPIPMTYKKLRIRGYNQSKIIAKIIAENTHTLLIKNNVLIKYKNNQVQSKLTKKQRLKNVQDVFKVKNNQVIKNKRILIFDDIYTTGATCNECAKVLKQAQPTDIGIITIAKDYGKIQTTKKGRNEFNGRFS